MVLGILQARLSSTRLPGKVLKPLLGEPMILRQVERLRRAQLMDQLVVATTVEASDDALVALCADRSILCHRGNLEDVLDRYVTVARIYQPETVVRLTADCPLTDPALIDSLIEYHQTNGFDYTTNTLEPSFPDGLDAEVVRWESLERAWSEAELPSEREHVTPYLRSHPELFKLGSYRGERDLSALRWTVDEPADVKLVEAIYAELYPKNHAFGTEDILMLLESRPELKTLNTQFIRNAGLAKSLAEDQLLISKRASK